MSGNSILRKTRLPILLTAMLLLAGCGYGPEETVTLEISGVPDEAQREDIQETLKTMTDGSGHSMSTSASGDTMTVSLAPVSDVGAFAEKIDFGEVTSVEGRTVRVAIGGDDGNEPEGGGTPKDDDGTPTDRGAASARGFDSPQAAFNAGDKAFAENDPEAIAGVLTTESLSTLAGRLMLIAGITVAADEEMHPEIKKVLGKHGLDLDSLEEAGPNRNIKSLVDPIRNKSAFIADMVRCMEENADKTRGAPGPLEGKLESLQVDGDSATAQVVTQGSKRTEPIEFRKVDGRWLVHLPKAQQFGGRPSTFDSADQPQPLSEKVVAAWKQAGAKVFFHGNDVPSAAGPPVFAFSTWKKGQLAALPPPQRPFALNLQLTSLDDAGLKEVVRLRHLQKLILFGTQVTDEGLKELAALKKLRRLNLGDTQVSDEGLEKVGALVNLRTLLLNGTQVTDAGLKHLAALKSLRYLYLARTEVTDAGLKSLTGLRRLVTLDLRETSVTEPGIEELKQTLPNLRTVRP